MKHLIEGNLSQLSSQGNLDCFKMEPAVLRGILVYTLSN